MSKNKKNGVVTQDETSTEPEVAVNNVVEKNVVNKEATKTVKKKDDKKAKNQKNAKKNKKEKTSLKQKTKETFSEFKKVTWPTFADVCKRTGVVLVVVLIFAVIIFGMDYGLGALVKLLTKKV